jgi:hypothetical protein
MRFDLDAAGAWLVDPNELVRRLGIATSQLLSQMRRGLVTSVVEPGGGKDEGPSRVTVRADSTGWQGIFDGDGALVSECSLSPQ